jgi:hypothetical protein
MSKSCSSPVAGSFFVANLRKDFVRHFAHRNAELEAGCFRAAPPPVDVPVGADDLHRGLGGKIEQDGSFSAIELLWKSRNRLGIESHAVGRPLHAHIKRFLLHDICNAKIQKKHSRGCRIQVECGAISFGCSYRVFGDKEGFNHTAAILAGAGIEHALAVHGIDTSTCPDQLLNDAAQ